MGSRGRDQLCSTRSKQEAVLAELFEQASRKGITVVDSLDEIPEEEFKVLTYARPPGYNAQTLLNFGRWRS